VHLKNYSFTYFLLVIKDNKLNAYSSAPIVATPPVAVGRRTTVLHSLKVCQQPGRYLPLSLLLLLGIKAQFHCYG